MVTETALEDYLADHPETVMLPEEYNSAIIGVSLGGRIAYNYMSLVKVLVEEFGLSYAGAYDFIDCELSGTRDIIVIDEL